MRLLYIDRTTILATHTVDYRSSGQFRTGCCEEAGDPEARWLPAFLGAFLPIESFTEVVAANRTTAFTGRSWDQ